jgi:hypothetical protein
MSRHGRTMAAHKKMMQQVNKQENKMYYQNSTEQKSPRTESERNMHRKLVGTQS